MTTAFQYHEGFGQDAQKTYTSTRVGTYTRQYPLSGASYTYEYTYDAVGNILSIRENGRQIVNYEYDDLGQLIRENNATANKTWVYTYDSRGNITGRTTYAFTATTPTASLSGALQVDTYEYFRPSYNMLWSDTLLRYNGIEYNSYDAIGNPISYYNTDFDTPYTFVWSEGRRLTSGTVGSTSFAYTYGTNGLRTSKTVNGQTYDYFWDGGRLSALTISNGSGTVIATMQFGYDDLGVPVTFNYNGTLYLYQTNLQGDVTGIYNQYGLCAYYEYDAWGKILKIDSAGSAESAAINANPLRYRGYIYDTETGFYYVSSRYYDPEICRWISADDTEYLGADGELLSYSLFAYCLNNPVNRTDINGNWSLPNWAKVAIGAVAIAGLAVATVCTSGAAAVICGAALSGAIAGGASGAVIGAIGGGISGGWEGALDGACSGFMSGTLVGGVTGAVSAGINIATGATTVFGNAHGSVLHKLATNMEAGKMAASGQYSQIGLNKALKTMGLNGVSRPDVIGIAKTGVNKLVEVVSPRQSTNYIVNKMSNMLSNNPRSVGKVITWVRNLFK